MVEENTYEILIDDAGQTVKGQKGGIQDVLIRLEQIELKIDEMEKKILGAKTG